MAKGLDALQHIVVLMMENRSFDHMLGGLKAQDPRIDGLTGTETNPDTTGKLIPVRPVAQYQSQLYPDPGHHYPDVDLQLYRGNHNGQPSMQGFIEAYYQQRNDVEHSHNIMNYFTPEQLPVLSTLARKFAVFNGWFSSIPGPTLCNRAFAHFGTSFGNTGMGVNYLNEPISSVYERMLKAGNSAKIYYFDQPSSTLGMAFLLKDQPRLFGTFEQFQADCKAGKLPQYSFLEPNYTDHGAFLASDQHPDHDVQAGEDFIGTVYNLIRANQTLWESTALLIVYDEHGGIYDHVPPPACDANAPDGFTDKETGFKFDRLGVRVPAILVSPWVAEGTVVDGRVFEHASIPATVTNHFIGANYDPRTAREKAASTFLDVLSLDAPRKDAFYFAVGNSASTHAHFGAAALGSSDMIPVGRPSAKASDPDRPISLLLQEHIQQLHEAESALPPNQQTGVDISTIKTEGDAGDYIERVTALLHPKVAGGAAR
jgi:phospholipase C